MAQIRGRIFSSIVLLGLTATLVNGVARAQSAAAPIRHRTTRTIQLTSQKITLPFGNQVFTGGEVAKLANSHCLLCHSRAMIDTQPPLSPATWKKEVEKMRTAYGCPLRADQTAEVADFISHAAGASTANSN